MFYPPIPPQPSLEEARARVLMAEDNEHASFLRQRSLVEMGYRVDVAKDGIEVIQKIIADDSYEVILMNIDMPRIDGYKATRFIRRKLSYRKPIIGFSVYLTTEDLREAHECGMSDHVPCLVNDDQIFEALEKQLKRIQTLRMRKAQEEYEKKFLKAKKAPKRK